MVATVDTRSESLHPSRLSGLLHDLSAAIDAVTAVIPFTVDRSELNDALFDALALVNTFESCVTDLTSAANATGVHCLANHRNLASYAASQSNVEPGTVRRNLRLGRWLRDFDLFAAAHAAGEMSRDHLDLIRTKLDGPTTHFDLVNAQQILVDAARDCTFKDFTTAAEYWLITIDPDGNEPADQVAKTTLSLRPGRGGRLVIKGQTDAISGQAIKTAIDLEAQKLWRTDAETGTVRTASQRQAAALFNLVTRGAARDDGTYPTALINIVMSEQVAEYLIDQAANPSDDPVPVRWNDLDRRCELIDGTPIHPQHVLGLLGTATLRRYLFDAESRVIDISVNARSFPEWMRVALHVQARGRCESHGCDASFHWIQADHVDPVTNGGRTEFGNGQNQCDPDNKWKGARSDQIAWRDRPDPERRRPFSHRRYRPEHADPGDDADDNSAN